MNKPVKITLAWNKGWIFTATYADRSFEVGDVDGENSAVGVFNACHDACEKLGAPTTSYTWNVVSQLEIEAVLNI